MFPILMVWHLLQCVSTHPTIPTSVPQASTSFVISAQYGHGADVVTAVTMLGIVLLVPAVLVGLTLPRVWGLYDFTLSSGAGL